MKIKNEVEIVFEKISLDPDSENLLKNLAGFILKELTKSYSKLFRISKEKFKKIEAGPVKFNLLVTNSTGIRSYNKHYRKLDKPTNVLTFSYITGSQEFTIEGDRVLLGEIILNWDEVLADAGEGSAELFESLSNLLSHSMLHLFGLEHSSPEDSRVMTEEKEKLIKLLKLNKQTLMEA